uniref:RNA polymerase II-associated factor 1 homolog n=1 Tax=Plectus sambesii TaxID=2011161 RepID=A0A914XF32_9BILA
MRPSILQENVSSSSANNSASQQRRPMPAKRPDAKDTKKRPDLLCRVRYCNTLPDIPFEPKFLACPFVDLSRFVEYKQTTLEKNYQYELLTEPDLGVKIDLINPDTYHIDYRTEVKMHPLDERLLEDEQTNPQDSKRSRQHSKIVPWMRKTEYISSEFNRFGVGAERQETKVGYSMKKKFENENVYRDRASQIEAISKTFDEAAKPVTAHYSKPGVTAVQVLDLLPDFELWKYPFAQVIFDSDPSPLEAKGKAQEMMSQALIRGMMDEQGEQFVAYFIPLEDTLQKRAHDASLGQAFTPEEEYIYQMTREYNWTVKNKASKGYEQENYFIVLRDTGAFYNELETRVRLNRRRAKEGHAKMPNSKLIVRNREETEQEVSQQEERVHRLLYPHEEEEAIEEPTDQSQSPPNDEGADSPIAKESKADKDDDDDDDEEAPVARKG